MKEGLSCADVARHYGVAKSTVTRWKRAGMPTLPGGRCDLAAVEAWHNSRQDRRGKRDGDALDPTEREIQADDQVGANDEDALYWLRRYRKAKAIKEELATQKAQGELIDKGEVERMLVHRATEFRRGLEALGRRLPPRLAHRDELEIAEELRLCFREILLRYSRVGVGNDA